MKARPVIAALALAAAVLPQTAAARIYAVIFAIKVDDKGTVDFSVAKVIDPYADNKDAVKGVPVSDAFIRAAREVYLAKNGAQAGFTFFYVDTDAPDVLARVKKP